MTSRADGACWDLSCGDGAWSTARSEAKKAVEGVRRGRMASKPAVNGHAAPISHQEDVPGTNHCCQGTLPCKQKAAGGDVAAMDAASEPSEVPGSIAGVYVEALKKIMSFYDATREHLLSLDPALFLLEAQAAMGFIADPVKNRHVSVAEAVHLGLVGLELKEKLLSAEKAATGFVDPYTEEKISLYQAIQKDLIGREQGARLLEAQMATGGVIDPDTGCRLPADVACERGYLDEEMRQLFSDPSNEDSKGFLDPSTMERVTYMELMKRCVVDPASGFLLLPLQITFAGLGGRVSSRDLLEAGIISPDTFRGLEEGRVSAQEVAESDSVQQFLRGTRSIAGVVLPSGERKSLYQALREHLLLPGTALTLLQVQASTGSLTDPIKNKTFSVDEAVRIGLIGPELHEKLSSAERTITGYRDPYTGEMLSLFQAVRKAFIPRDHGIFLLEAQMATGGIIAPGRHFRVPTETACKWGYLDETTRQLLSSPADELKGFFDPNSKEKLTYADLLKRCVTDPNTGLLLLPLSGDSGEGPKGTPVFFDHKTQMALENTKVPITLGKFKGKSVSLWKLLFSDYIQSEQRAALTQQYLAGTLSMQQLAKAVSVTIEEMASTANVTFEGLRGRVTADQLLSSEIINKDLFKKLKEGETSAKEVVSMDTVKKYLQGTGSIAGLLLPDSQEKMSIYQAKRKGFLRPGTSLILLEAQAATGFIIDPAANKSYSVDEALQANVIGPDVYDKLLTAEKSVTGYRDPYSGTKISLFQAMKKELIVKEHAIRLLEAQIATGGIIDPVNSHRIPVEVAYKRGYFDKKMNVILSDPSDDTKGFFDPNTHENLTYLQLKEKCITEPSTGLCLLPLNSRKRQFIDDATRQLFRNSWMPVRFGRLRGEKVSVWDLLNSEYFSEGRRREIFNHYRLRKLTLEQIRIMLEEEIKKWAPIKFPAMRGSISAYHLMDTGIIDRALFEKVLEGSVTPEEVLRMDSVRRYLYGSGSIGGIVLQPSNQRISIYEAMKQNIMVPGVALPLLEAQAATGFIIDPVNNQKLCVDDAVKEGVIGPEVHEKLQQAEGAVSGYKDPFTGKKIPLFQAMKKGLITDKQAMQLMEVQMATGGIIDPTCGHHLPIEAAQKRGCLDEDTSKALSKPSDNNRAFCVPDSKETVTYAELIERCQKDEISGFHLLPLPQTAVPVYTDEQIQQLFKETMVKEKGVSLWELIHSGYFTDEQRSDFVERFRAKELSLQQLVALVLRLVREMEMKACTHITFQGLQGSVPAVWLLEAGIITEKMFEELAQGIRTPEEVAEMESVKRYLQGTGSIAGVIIQASKKKMSFYNAMKNNLLLPGAALKLLEAQAATGYLTDPATNQRLSVRDAVRAAVVGEELTEKLLLAERAVTGYTDPYTGSSISLCQAVRKELIPLGEAIPLLEAQLATGGVIDPIHHHHLPLQAAYRYGFYDEDLNQNLTQLNDSTKIFFDPNTKENVTYQQLKDRCIYEAETGLWFLPLSENAMFYVDEQTMEMLKSVTVCVNIGRFKGQTVSVWDLLNSEYISDRKRRELVQKYKDENTEVLHEIIMIVMKIIKETEVQGKKFAFKGLRKRVSASDLFQSQLIDKKTLDELNQGKKTVKEVTEMDSVRRYLEGSNFIAGVLIQPSNEKMSIYQAMRKGILRPGTALVLLEAQAATGYIIDPEKNKKFSVEEAFKAGLIGCEIFEKLLCAERAVTGYIDPYTKAPMSLFEAMNQGLIVKSHGIRLLEAQIATGGIIDPVHSHRLPVEAAYKRGYFDQEMNQILSDPTDDTKGFFDPNTQENLTYLQLMERCVTDPDTGLCLLPLTDQVAAGRELVYTDQEAKDVFKKATVTAPFGKFQGKTVTIWEIINSEYFTEDQRRDLIQQYRTGKITVEKIIKIIITVVEESERKSQMCFEGLRAPVPAAELLESKIINKDLYNQLHQGKKSVKDVAEMESVRQYLKGTDAIAGILVESTGQKLTFYDALKRNLLKPEIALSLLEAQAATGYIIDPVRNKLFSVDEAVKAEAVGPEFHEKLLSAEKAVTGYKDPYTGQTVSLFQALKKGLIPGDTGIRLLDVQLATGGIIDPVNSHRLPLEVAYKRGYFDPEMNEALSAAHDEIKAFYCPNTQEHVTYAQLQKNCHRDKQTGFYLLPLSDKAIQSQQEEIYTDSQAKESFDKAVVEVPAGSLKGQTMTIWELIHSEYFTEEHRRELLRQYKTGKVTIEKIIKIVITIIEETETKKQEKLTFTGLRAPVPASELVESRIISKAQYEQLKEGKKSVKELAETEAVRRFLHGSDCIAGVYVEATKEKLNIYEAMKRNLLRSSTAVVLLEAQAATGFLIDPVKNRKLYVNEAVKAGVVGPELHEKLLSAEKAVTGYKDPYSGNTISLFEAMKKGLIVKEHAIRLLEAQIATGGIIDPVHSHRLPVEVAYKRGYFDEEMNRILSNPTDDTKGFFDPNTHENLTYMQLKERCIEDPETGLYLLPLREPEKPTVVETTHVYTEAETRKVFEETQVDIPVGSRAGSSMSLWEIMHSDLLPEEQRKQLMEEFQSGRVSKERMIIIIIEIIEKTEIIRQQNLTSYDYVRRRITAEDLYEAKIISQDIYNLLKQGSKTFRELLDVETIWKYLYGSGCVAGIYIPSSKQNLSIYQALKKGLISSEVARSLLEAQAATGFMIDPIKNEMLTVDEAVRKGLVGPEIHDRLLSAERAVTGYRDPYSEQKISIFQAMKKDLIPSEEALKLLDAQIATGGIIDPHLGFHLPLEVAYQRGFINKDTYDMLSEPSEVRSYVDPSTDEKLSYTQLLKRCRKDEASGLLLLPLCDTRKLTFRGLRKQITVEELVRSQVMDEATAQRLQEGLTSIEEVSKNLKKFLEGTSCIAGVFVDSTKERLSVYQAMKKGIIRPGTAFELLEAQAATGYVIDPIKGLKLTVEEAVRMGIVGPEFKDKLLSAERAVTGYRDPYTGKLISLFQAMKKGLILKDHGIRLLEAQIATGGIIDPEESHRLPVEIAYKRGLFDEEMNEILLDPSDDTKGFFDPNTEENLTYLQLMERCITDPETGLCLLPLKEKKRERKTSSKSSVRKRRVVIVDPETGKEMSVYEAYRKGLIDHQTYLELSEQECEWEEITTSSSDGVVKSMIIDRRSGRQYDIDDAISKGLIDQSALDQYRSGTLSITEFADMLSGNMGGFRSRSSSVGSSSSYTVSPAPLRTQMWSDPTEETGPVAGILDTDTLEKVSITEAMHRNLVDNITGQRLLEAQACTGGIIDPNTGDKCSVADAVNKGLVDKIMVDRINLAQKAFYGFEDPRTKTKMSAAQALKKGWLYYEAGQRFLEVQYLTGGLIEPDVEGRVSLDEALQKGTIDTRTAQKLRDVNTYSKYLTCPKTKLKISYKDAMDRSMIEDGTGLRLLEASSQSSKGYYSPYNVSSAGSTSGSRSGSRTGSRSSSRRGSFDATGSGFSMTYSSSSFSSSSFGRRYTAGPQSAADAGDSSITPSLLSGRCGQQASVAGLWAPPLSVA